MNWVGIASLTIVTSITVTSCKSSQPVASATKSAGFSCDLQSSAAASNDASQRAFKCAYNSLKTAGKLATGTFVADVANVVEGIKQVYDGYTAASDIFFELQEFINNNGQTPIDLQTLGTNVLNGTNSGGSVFEKTELGKKIKRKAMYGCLSGQFKAVRDLVSLANTASQLDGQSQLSVSNIQSLSNLGISGIKSMLGRMDGLAECTQWLAGERSKSMVQLSKGVKNIATSLDVVLSIGNCGVDLAYGGYVLYNNSACLVEDISNYYEGRERLDNQRENFVNNSEINQDGGFSINACMIKYGIHLYDAGPGSSFNTRAYMCAEYCGNKGKGMNYMRANMEAIFPIEADRQYCERVARTSQDNESINSCIVYCCDQDGICRDSAWDKLRYYDL